MSVKILGIGTELGYDKIPESEICKRAGKEPGFLKARTYLESVYYRNPLKQGSVTDMFVSAILKALIDARVCIDDIDGIFVSHSGTNKDKVLSFASILSTELGLNNGKNVIAKDINAACVGFGDALDTGFKQILSDGSSFKNYIIVAGDVLGSEHRDPSDINTGMLSDGAGAMIISNHPDRSSNLTIKNAASGMATGVDISNIASIHHRDGEYLTMSNGRELGKSLVDTADQIFSLLGIEKLKNGTMIIPHQPNGRMIEKWGKASTLIADAKEKGRNIDVHSETYTHMGNTSGASTIFALDRIINTYGLPKRCKRIILAPFGAGGHMAGIEINVKNTSNISTFVSRYIDSIFFDKDASQRVTSRNDDLFSKDAPLSYKKYIGGRFVEDHFSDCSVSVFLPEKRSIPQLLGTIDMLHWRALMNKYPDRSFITKSISYHTDTDREYLSDDDEPVNQYVSGHIGIGNIKKKGQTKSGKNIYQVKSQKDGIVIVSEFCEIDAISPVEIPDESYTKYQGGDQAIAADEINLYGGIGGYASIMRLMKQEDIYHTGSIYFVGTGEMGNNVSVCLLKDVPSNYRVPSSLRQGGNRYIYCLINNSKESVIAYFEKDSSRSRSLKADVTPVFAGLPF